MHGPVTGCKVSRCFRGRGDVLRASRLQDVLGSFDPVRIVAVYREQNTPVLDTAFVTFSLILRHAESDENTHHTAGHSSGAGSGQRTHNRPGGDKWSQPRNSQRTYSSQPPERAAQQGP